jgi:hypothetical protein
MLTRKPRTEWAAHAIHEYKELLRDAALYLMQETEDKGIVRTIVTEHIQEARQNIEALFDRDAKNPDFKLDEVYEIDPERVDQEALELVTDETEQIRKGVQRILTKKDYFEKMEDLPFIQMGFLRIIDEMQTKVRRATAKPERNRNALKTQLERLDQKTVSKVKVIQKAKWYKMGRERFKTMVSNLLDANRIDNVEDLEKMLGLEESISLIIKRNKLPKEQYKKNDYIKLRNWIIHIVIAMAHSNYAYDRQLLKWIYGKARFCS